MTRQTKIITTIGPATDSYYNILKLYRAGMNHCRINFSHGTHDGHAGVYEHIHQVRLRNDLDIGVIADLQGPKNRLGDFEDKRIPIHEGQRIRFDKDTKTLGSHLRISVSPPQIIDVMTKDQRFLINDGNVGVMVEEIGPGFFIGRVMYGTELSNRKGVNTPDVTLPIPALTDKDKKDLEFALGLGVDWVALSFVQRVEDIREAKELIKGRARLIAKIETPGGVANYGEILAEADGIMIARGDLGVEFPYEQLPIIQRYMIDAGREAGKPVIVATQMMETMIEKSVPTRSEANDVSTAVAQGASAVMLSAETAIGKYPVKTVETMANIIKAREEYMRDPHRYMQKIFRKAKSGHELSSDLPPPVSLDTWQERRLRGEAVLLHLNGRNGHHHGNGHNGHGHNGNGLLLPLAPTP